MSRISEMADDLAAEVLTEAASSFFGQRKSLDQELEFFGQRVQELQVVGQKAQQEQACLHGLMLDEEHVREFYAALRIPVPDCLELAPLSETARICPRPRGWTMSTQFYKLLTTGYVRCRKATNRYMHGEYQTDPRNSRKKLALMGYGQLVDWAQRLNSKVHKLNVEQAPSDVLSFVKSLDVQGCAREEVAGASCEVDRNSGLLFKPVDLQSLRLPVFPDYPPLAKAQPAIKGFAKRVRAQKTTELNAMLDALKRYWASQ